MSLHSSLVVQIIFYGHKYIHLAGEEKLTKLYEIENRFDCGGNRVGGLSDK